MIPPSTVKLSTKFESPLIFNPPFPVIPPSTVKLSINNTGPFVIFNPPFPVMTPSTVNAPPTLASAAIIKLDPKIPSALTFPEATRFCTKTLLNVFVAKKTLFAFINATGLPEIVAFTMETFVMLVVFANVFKPVQTFVEEKIPFIVLLFKETLSANNSSNVNPSEKTIFPTLNSVCPSKSK